MRPYKIICSGLGLALAVAALPANASHFRGAAIVPTITNGVLMLEVDSFWRKGTATGNIFTSNTVISGGPAVSNYTLDSQVIDTSDIRRDKATTVLTADLNGAGTYNIAWNSCCHQSGISNASGNWGMDASIVWDGANDTAPIFFDLENIQQQVVVNSPYSDNLDATPGGGQSLSYNLSVNTGMTGQAPGLAVDAAGNLTLSAATTGAAPYNPGFTNGTAFSGNIFARDSTGALTGMVEYEWVFLSCDPAQQNCAVAPFIQDEIINALIGANISQTMLAVQDNGQLFQAPNLITNALPNAGGGWDTLQSFNCTGAVNNAPGWNAVTQQFSWNTAGSGAGQCTALFQVTDAEGLTDTGALLINLSSTPPACGQAEQPPCPTSVASTLPLMGLGLVGFGWLARRRRANR